MKELPDFSQIHIGNHQLASLQMKGPENLVAQAVPAEKSSPEVVGNLDSIETAVALGGVGLAALTYGLARKFRHGTDHIDELAAPYVAAGAFALATAFYIIDALSS